MSAATRHVLVDMDGVIANWGKGWDYALDNDYSTLRTRRIPRHQDQRSFNLTEGLDVHEKKIVAEVMASEDFYLHLEPIEGAADALREMVAAGHLVSLVTSPWLDNPTCASDKLAWAEKHIGPGWAKRVVITSDKTQVRGDILIDDKPGITGALVPEWEHVLFDQPYNFSTTGRRRLFKWREWRDLLLPPAVHPVIDRAASWATLHAGERVTGKEDVTCAITDDFDLGGVATLGAQLGVLESDFAYTVAKFGASGEVRTTSSTGGQKGVKDDRFDLIPVGALTALARHYGVGARKYDDNQWRKGYEWSKSYAALQRHINAWWGGEDIDEETGSSHLAAVAWHAFTLLTFIEEYPQFDDRYTTQKEIAA